MAAAGGDDVLRAVSDGLETLREAGVRGPYALALGPRWYTDLAKIPGPGRYLSSSTSAASSRVRVRSPLGIRAAVVAGAGAGLLAPYLGDDPSLRKLVGPPPLLRDLYLVYHRPFRRTARVQIVSRFLADCLRGLEGG